MSISWKYVLGGVAFTVLCILGYFWMPKETVVVTHEEEIETYIFVHITGCVNNPGLKKMKYGTRIFELIEEAGGTTEEADITRVNLASIVHDEQKVVIPAKIVATDEDGQAESQLVNINTASKEKLMTLPGVGAGTAEKIIQYREKIGYFNAIEDLMQVSGIGQNKFEAMKEQITI